MNSSGERFVINMLENMHAIQHDKQCNTNTNLVNNNSILFCKRQFGRNKIKTSLFKKTKFNFICNI